MIGPDQRRELIELADEAHAFSHGEFESAASIAGNFKIELAEAMQRESNLRLKFAGYIISELEQVEVNIIIATGGAVDLAEDVAQMAGWEFREIESRRSTEGKKYFFIDDDTRDEINDPSMRTAYVEDVSSTWQTVIRSIESADILDPLVAISAWRRGRPAPIERKNEWLLHRNIENPSDPPFEAHANFPVMGIIECPVPMRLNHKSEAGLWIPELVKD